MTALDAQDWVILGMVVGLALLLLAIWYLTKNPHRDDYHSD